jgi:predicted MPP superfamily phosphohydrolase
MEETLFAWVHLSDIHVGHGDPSHRWDQQLVLQEIARDVATAPRAGLGIPAPQAILVTGDVAFSGNGVVRAPDTESREYARARAWLLEMAGKLGLGAKDVFVVPGNHDVDRGKDRDRSTARLVRALQGGDSLDEALASPDDRRSLAARMGAYLAFSADLAPACLSAPAAPEERLWWQHRLARARGLTVRLVGLNTALLCSGDDDLGRLRLGHEQIARTFNEPPIADAGELVIALSHHPLRDWLADAVEADRLLRRYAHLHLSGHVHGAESEESRTGGGRGGFLRVVAGAAHAERQASREIPAGHGYNFAAVVADASGALRLRLWPRRWSDQNRDFRPDVEHIPQNQSFAEHALSVRCSPAQPRPAPLGYMPPPPPPRDEGPYLPPPVFSVPAPSVAPVEVVIFHSPKDDELREELETHLDPLVTSGAITTLSVQSIDVGADGERALAERAASAQIFLVLVSSSFLASPFFKGAAFATAVERAKRHEATLVCVYLKPCEWKTTWMHSLQWLPRVDRKGERKPVSQRDHDEAFMEVSQEMRQLVTRLQSKP